MKKILIIILLVIIAVAIYTGYDFYRKSTIPYKGFEGGVKIEIPGGSTITDIALMLKKEKIIPNYLYFRIYYKLFHSGSFFKSGEYNFSKPMTVSQVIRKLIKGDIVLYKITIKEGMTIDETAEYLSANHNIDQKKFLDSAGNPSSVSDLDNRAEDLEGYLFPETYMISKGTTANEIVKNMVNNFRKSFSESYRIRAGELDLSIREILTLASLIEKETATREERFLISSVFHNRLRIGMPMGCDPTIIYALKKEGKWDGNIRWKDLKMDSPYNTRIHRGLPPGPICSPGIHSIEAALFPENTKYLYFVAKDSSTHYFSKNLKEHNWAVRKFILNKKKK
ncbi:MAG: endolytic transglycosylase MltG [Acidobacteriota bacterium]